MTLIPIRQLPRVVIIGGGFGGLEVAMRLRKTPVQITLVDRQNYHLFQPLLYQVATGGLSPANIAAPLRSILRKHGNVDVAMAEVTGFDTNRNRVLLADGSLDYDFLVLSAGATHSYFGNDQWRSVAPGLKTISDATEMRRRIFVAFEAAERETDPEIRASLMTFVIVGGGPTGVELAGALAEIARHTLAQDFRHIDPEDARIIIVEAGEHLLGHYPKDLCEKAEKQVRSFGIEIMTNCRVTEITSSQVTLNTPEGQCVIDTHTVLWGAGVQANPLGKKLAQQVNVEPDRAGRLPVTPLLQIDGHEALYVIGDIARCLDDQGNPLPGLASVAVQQGKYVAQSITKVVAQLNRQQGDPRAWRTRRKDLFAAGPPDFLTPFHYADRGTMATIGRAAAVAQIGNRHFHGFVAWFLWLFVHLMLIVQFQNRLLILMQWAYSYTTFNRSARIIIGEKPVKLIQCQALPESADRPSAMTAN